MKDFVLKKTICLLLVIFMGVSVNAQSVVDLLPYTYRVPFPNGFMECTIHENGSMTSTSYSVCYACGGLGNCHVCGGTGGTYYYELGILPCGACFGTGRCSSCSGKGYCVISSFTQYGITVAFDDRGKIYVENGSSTGSGSNSSSRNKIEVIEYVPTLGIEENEHVYCPKCKKSGRRHIHVLK